METNQSSITKKHKIVCEDMHNLSLSGINKVESATENQVACSLNGHMLLISGKNLHVKKLDVNEGTLEIDGQIEQIKYQDHKKPFLKRIFK